MQVVIQRGFVHGPRRFFKNELATFSEQTAKELIVKGLAFPAGPVVPKVMAEKVDPRAEVKKKSDGESVQSAPADPALPRKRSKRSDAGKKRTRKAVESL